MKNKKTIIVIVVICFIISIGVLVINKQKQEQKQKEQELLEIAKNERKIDFENYYKNFMEAAALQTQIDMMNNNDNDFERCYVFSEETKNEEYSLKKRWAGPKYFEGSVHVILSKEYGRIFMEGWLKNEEFYIEKNIYFNNMYDNIEIKELGDNPKFESTNCKNASSYAEMKKQYDEKKKTIESLTP